MSEFNPVETYEDLQSLDDDQCLRGYRDAMFFGVHEEPGNSQTRSYWYGWRNGMVDRGLKVSDQAQQKLVKDLRLMAQFMAIFAEKQ